MKINGSFKIIANHLLNKLRGFYEFVLDISFMEIKTQKMKEVKDEIISFSGKFEDYFISIVDIVDSTKITTFLSQKQACKYYAIFLNAMATIVEEFGGCVVKNIGDSLLYYFPKKNNLSGKILSKISLDCGFAMLDAVKTINKIMESEHLPPIKYRISSDYGTVMIAREFNSNHDDIFGPPVNMCSKINRHAKPNSMVIGGDMYEISKTFDEYTFKKCSDCSAGLKFSYPVFLIESNLRNLSS